MLELGYKEMRTNTKVFGRTVHVTVGQQIVLTVQVKQRGL